jgi:nicotinamide-nucleotide amidase
MDKAVILSTGEELITGKVVDTNSSYIADKLFFLGVEVVAILKVGDNRERLLWAIDHAAELGDLIIGTGGLGPTVDDLTTETVARYIGRPLELHEDVATALKRRFEDRGRPWTENNLKQAQFPEGAKVIPNPRGTAPGFRIAIGEHKWLIWLSGVPREMVEMMLQSVVPWISQTLKTDEVAAATFKIYGLTESKLDDILKPVHLPNGVQLSFRAHYPDLSLRLIYRGGKEDSEQFQGLKARIGKLIQPYVFGEGDETLEEIVGRLLLKNGWTLALAESCTGGYISHRITRVPGSSDYFKSSAVTYSNEAKMAFLGVKKSTLNRFGPVSRETAIEMAQGIRKKTGANVGMSVTGIAGPDGGSPEIPVGTAWIGMAQPHGEEAQIFHLQGDRERVIQGASQAVLHWLRKVLL